MDIETYINRLKRIRSLNAQQKDFKTTDVYRLLIQEQSLIASYEKMKSNKGALTPSSDKESLDGFGRKRLDTLREQLANESWQPRPARRKYIPKPGGTGMRPLGIQGPEEKIVQASMLTILEAIYEPCFLETSYGFRPSRGAHDALKRISEQYDRISYIIEADIQGMYDAVNHGVLVKLVEQKVDDPRFIRLLWKMLRAGYMESNEILIKPIVVTPQGSVVSPILANIYLHELDIYMEKHITQKQTKRTKNKTPIYHKLNYQCKLLKKQLTASRTERDIYIKRLKLAKMKHLNTRMYLDAHPRVYYSRYADDFIIGIAGSKEMAENLIQQIQTFLQTKLKLNLNLEKTKLTNPKTSKALFLGHEISIDTSTKLSYVHAKGKTPFLKKTTGKFVKITAPIEKIIKRLHLKGFCDAKGFPTPKKIWTTQDDQTIVYLYQSTIAGLFNFYSGCHLKNRLNRIWYILRFSCAMTLATKHKSSIHKMFKKHGYFLTITYGKDGKKTMYLTKPETTESSRKWVTGKTLTDPYILQWPSG